jgi:predicted nucleic acid-binding Zn ribbon protein
MQISALIIGFFLFGAALVFVSRPFWEKRKKGNKDSSSSQVSRRESVLAALRDLDFDFKTGKVSEEDYQPLRAQLLAEAAQYIESEKNTDEKLEALIQARRKAPQKIKCEHCGTPMEADQKFCSKCGTVAKTEACPSCGKKIRVGDTFCSSCGTKIEVRLEATA